MYINLKTREYYNLNINYQLWQYQTSDKGFSNCLPKNTSGLHIVRSELRMKSQAPNLFDVPRALGRLRYIEYIRLLQLPSTLSEKLL